MKQSGAVLPFVAITLTMIIALIALGFDISFLVGSTVEYKRLADAAALAVARDYRNSTSTNYAVRLNSAIGSAKELLADNMQLTLAEKQFETQDRNLYLNMVSSNNNNVGAVAVVTPGIWHFYHPDSGALPAECYSGLQNPANFQQCFEPISFSSEPTAFRVEVLTPSSNRIKNWFARVFGEQVFDIEIRAASIAAQVPRRAQLAVDITSSTWSESHLGTQNRYSFDLVPGQSCAEGANYSGSSARPSGAWNNLSTSTEHPQSDYRCTKAEYFNASTGQSYTRYFLIDSMTAPQPLRDIYSAVNSTMIAFQQRRVSGDRVGFIGFDNELIEERATRDDVNGGPFGLTNPVLCPSAGSEFCLFLSATNPVFDGNGNLNAPNFVNFRNRHLFPRGINDAGAFARTDIPSALDQAIESLVNHPGRVNADNYIVVYSDGESNCLSSTDCQIRNGYIAGSLDRALDLGPNGILTKLRKYRIKLIFVLIGKDSVPHNVLIGNGKTCTPTNNEVCCLDEVNYNRRKQQGATSLPDWVDPADLVDTNGDGDVSNDNYQSSSWPNNWQRLAEATNGGAWVPVRPPCEDFYATGVTQVQVEKAFNILCSGANKNNTVITPDSTFAGNFSDVSSVLDNNGRLLCDRENRSTVEQLRQSVNSVILDVSPYVLVDDYQN